MHNVLVDDVRLLADVRHVNLRSASTLRRRVRCPLVELFNPPLASVVALAVRPPFFLLGRLDHFLRLLLVALTSWV